jgi:hypothetical protein
VLALQRRQGQRAAQQQQQAAAAATMWASMALTCLLWVPWTALLLLQVLQASRRT